MNTRDSALCHSPAATSERPLHRIGAVRRQQGLSLRAAARRMGTHASKLRSEEADSADLRLSDLYRWQRVLEVPVSDLLIETSAPLSRPVMDRARLLRLMKTAAAIREKSQSSSLQRMAENLINQLVEIMPELADVASWHSVGQRRGSHELGQAYHRRLADGYLGED